MVGASAPSGAGWAVRADQPALGTYHLYGATPCVPLFTENESNVELIWGGRNACPSVKDAFHRLLVERDASAVNPEPTETKFAA
jgi:hypothetical protein